MDIHQVYELLEQNKNPKGIEHWQAMSKTGGLSSYGIGLTAQRKLARKIGRDRELAQQLWVSDNYDAKVLGLLIDDPKQITREQAEQQVEQLNAGMLCHVFACCDASLAKSPIALEIADLWMQSQDDTRRRCAYGLVYELSKKKSKQLTDEFFMSVIERISAEFEGASKAVRFLMGTALMGIGKRSKTLNHRALALAQAFGPIDFNEDGGKCDPFDVSKHLTSDYIKQKLGI